MLIEAKPKKVFEKPKPGLHLGVLADVIYYKNVITAFGTKDQVRFVWVLEKKDAEGNHFTIRSRPFNQSIDPKSKLYEAATYVRNGVPPPIPFDPDDLIGSVSILGVVHVQGTDATGQPTVYANVSSINTAEENQKFAIPTGFVRDKDKEKKPYGVIEPQRAVATTASAQAAPAATATVDDTEEIDF
jgi:hypothetical protein